MKFLTAQQKEPSSLAALVVDFWGSFFGVIFGVIIDTLQ